jgi:hypothetical protein
MLNIARNIIKVQHVIGLIFLCEVPILIRMKHLNMQYAYGKVN